MLDAKISEAVTDAAQTANLATEAIYAAYTRATTEHPVLLIALEPLLAAARETARRLTDLAEAVEEESTDAR